MDEKVHMPNHSRALATSGRPRVLLLTATLGYGGAETAFLRLADYLSRDMDVTIALMSLDAGSVDYSPAKSQVDLPVVILGGEDAAPGNPVAKSLRWLQMIRRLRALKQKNDATISFLSGPNLLNALAGRRQATIISERGSKRFDTGMTTRQRFVWTRFLDPLAYRGASYIVAASRGLAGEISDAHPRVSRRVHAFEGTVLTDRLLTFADTPCEPEFDRFSAWATVAAFGRMHSSKGFDALIEVFAHVRARMPDARLLLVGDGPEYDNYITKAKALGLRAGTVIDPVDFDVVFAGYRPDPYRYLRFARVFAMTSRFEGLPNALIEALASGIPILAADCPWGPRSVLAGEDEADAVQDRKLPLALTYGTLMPLIDSPKGKATWEAHLTEALTHPPVRTPYEVRRAAVARFDIEVTGKAWASMIESIAASQANPGSSSR